MATSRPRKKDAVLWRDDSQPISQRPRLHKLKISNYRSIGPEPVEIELDEIVVLVGPNNAGKSSILRAYKLIMEHGSSQGKLTLEDFPGGKVDQANPPTIELETVVYDETAPGKKWVRTDSTNGDLIVREKWVWTDPGVPKKIGWDVDSGNWHESEVPWGAANVAQAFRPKPHFVSAFDDPGEQADLVIGLFKEALNERTKQLSKQRADSEKAELTDYEKLLDAVKALKTTVASDANSAIENVRLDLNKMISGVFPGYEVTLDAKPEEDLEKNLFASKPELKMGFTNGPKFTIERQGSGACRTLIWSALRILADHEKGKNERAQNRPNVLLMDEPEMCLHPDAIREARDALYQLPASKNWQVMITTHSPVFIDFARDNTTIVRVERQTSGVVSGTTIYRPTRARLDDDDKAQLKLLNQCDPYVAEFFFGGRTIIVEGDTEYTAFKYVIANNPSAYKDVHIVRARGKACLVSLCKILNQFGKRYAVVHDSDKPQIKTKRGVQNNPAWTANEKLLKITEDGRNAGRIRLVALVPNIEAAFLPGAPGTEKPYQAFLCLKEDGTALAQVTALLDSLLDFSVTLPKGAVEWSTIEDLEAALGEGVRYREDASSA